MRQQRFGASDTDDVGNDGGIEFLAAFQEIRMGDFDKIKRRIEQGLNINTLSKECKESLLMQAAWFNQVEILNYLISLDANCRQKDYAGWSVLHFGCVHFQILKTLLQTDAKHDISSGDMGGVTPFMNVCDLQFKDGITRHTDLELTEKRLPCLQLLLDQGVDINQGDDTGRTPLMIAAELGALELSSWLIEKGAKPNSADEDGKTPLMIASGLNDIDLVKILIQGGGDVKGTCRAGKTPPQYSDSPEVKSFFDKYQLAKLPTTNHEKEKERL